MGGNAKVRKAVIPAAGLGTRMLPATKSIPKELLPVVDRPLIHYVIEEIIEAGIEEVIFVISKGKETILDYFDRDFALESFLAERKKLDLLEKIKGISQLVEVTSVRQKEPLGLGHAVLVAKNVVGNEPFAVVLPDDIVDAEKGCLKQLMEVYIKTGKPIIALERVPKKDTEKYGIIKGKEERKGLWRIDDLVEKPSPEEAPSDLAVIGRYILPAEIFDILEETKPGKGGEIQLTDALKVIAKNSLFGLVFAGTRYDLGNPLGFILANITYGLKREELKGAIKNYLK